MIRFSQLLPAGPELEPASRTLHGCIPERAARYCEPLAMANGYGWTIGAPIDITLKWDGASFWQLDDGTWRDFDYVGFSYPDGETPIIAATSPTSPSTMDLDYGIVQVWTGLVARTPPGIGLLVRGLVNFPRWRAFDVLEGVIETDWYLGPIVTDMRFTKTDEPVELRVDRPIFQLLPVELSLVRASQANGMWEVADGLNGEDEEGAFHMWAGSHPIGSYKKTSRAEQEQRP